VLLIDADLHRPKQEKIFNLPQDSDKGLSGLLVPLNMRASNGKVFGPINVDKNVHILKLTKAKLSVLPSGPIPPNPAELLGSAQMRDLLSGSAAKYDFVILDCPPILAVHDGIVLSKMVDGVILVVDMSHTRRNHFKHAVERLREVNAPLFGVVLNRVKRNMEGYSYYYLQQKYLEQESAVGNAATDAMPSPQGELEKTSSPRRLGLPIGQLTQRLGGSGKPIEPKEEL
jgi:capsular exopolysaccharide synthesis family protein